MKTGVRNRTRELKKKERKGKKNKHYDNVTVVDMNPRQKVGHCCHTSKSQFCTYILPKTKANGKE